MSMLLRHNAKSSIAEEERLATSPYLVTGFYLPHAIVVSLCVRENNVVILTPKKLAEVYPCRYDFPSRMKPWMLPGPGHRGLTTMWTLFTCSLN